MELCAMTDDETERKFLELMEGNTKIIIYEMHEQTKKKKLKKGSRKRNFIKKDSDSDSIMDQYNCDDSV